MMRSKRPRGKLLTVAELLMARETLMAAGTPNLKDEYYTMGQPVVFPNQRLARWTRYGYPAKRKIK